MSENLEEIIRRWGRSGAEGPAPPAAPTDRCLSFPQAESAARAGHVGEDQRRHVAECPYCAGLVADFREAIAEGPPAEQLEDAAPPAGQRGFVKLTYRYLAWAAAAAILLLAVVAGIFLLPGGSGNGAMLAEAQVGLREEILTGMTARGDQSFASGQAIMFRLRLARPACVMLINVDPNGSVVSLPPLPEDSRHCVPVNEADVLLGPYRLDETTGTERFLVIAARVPVADLPSRVRDLQAVYAEKPNAESLGERVRAWPAEVRVIRFEHVAGKP